MNLDDDFMPTDVLDTELVEQKESDTVLENNVAPITKENIDSQIDTTISIEDDVTDNWYYNTAFDLIEKGLLDVGGLDEADYKFEEWNAENFTSLLEKSLAAKDKQIEDLIDKNSEELYSVIVEGMSEITRKGFEFEKNNPESSKIKEFYQQLVYESDIKSLNPSDTVDAYKILEEHYKSIGYNAEESKEAIENVKDIAKEAARVKPNLDKRTEEIALKKIAEEDYILQFELDRKAGVQKKLNTLFSKPKIGEIPLTKEVKAFLYEVFSDEADLNIKGKTVRMSGADAMIFEAKYGTVDELERLAQALILYNSPDFFNSYYIKNIQTKETERKVAENKQSATVKAGNVLIKPKSIAVRKPNGMSMAD